MTTENKTAEAGVQKTVSFKIPQSLERRLLEFYAKNCVVRSIGKSDLYVIIIRDFLDRNLNLPLSENSDADDESFK